MDNLQNLMAKSKNQQWKKKYVSWKDDNFYKYMNRLLDIIINQKLHQNKWFVNLIYILS